MSENNKTGMDFVYLISFIHTVNPRYMNTKQEVFIMSYNIFKIKCRRKMILILIYQLHSYIWDSLYIDQIKYYLDVQYFLTFCEYN